MVAPPVDVAQLVERGFVVPEVAGSSPVFHPEMVGASARCTRLFGTTDVVIGFRAPVAQLDRAPDFESVGRRFESCRARERSLISDARVADLADALDLIC